jgi:hypothetical protein
MILLRQKSPGGGSTGTWTRSVREPGQRLPGAADDRYPSTDDHQSVRLDYPYPDAARQLNRWLPLMKWFLAIPHYVVLAFLDIAAVVVVVVAWFAPEALSAEQYREAFLPLDEEPGVEFVMGMIGKFMTPTQMEFRRFDLPEFGKLAFNFLALPYGAGRSLLCTETRTATTDPVSARRQSLLADLANLRAHNERLRRQVTKLARRLSEALGEEVFRASGLGGPDETEALRGRVAELEQTTVDLRQQFQSEPRNWTPPGPPTGS